MSWFEAAGLLQGLTEFLPISSRAHLRVFSALAGQRCGGLSRSLEPVDAFPAGRSHR